MMNCIEERILKDGIVKEGNVLKVDSFLNHQMDIELFREMGVEWKKRFAEKNINKILTIEASGIGIACVAAIEFGVPVVFAKKAKSINLEGEMYTAEVESFTHKNKNQVIVSKKFLGPEDHVLIIDDFLANGCALQGLIQIVKSAISTLSFSELEAITHIFEELDGNEGILVASKIADRVGITRSVIVNALRKFESAGVIESRSSGMKGTYIKVLNDVIFDELKTIKAANAK